MARKRGPIQEKNSLVLGPVSHADEGALGQVLGGGRGGRVAGAIALGRARVRVDAEEGVGRQAGGRDGDVEAAGEVRSQLCVGLGVGGQRGQRGLGMGASSAVPAERREVEGHGERRRQELAVISGEGELCVLCRVVGGVCGVWLRACSGRRGEGDAVVGVLSWSVLSN